MNSAAARHGVAQHGRRAFERGVEVTRAAAERFLGLQGIDRATALAAQAFTALIPLLIVYSAVVSRSEGRDFADRLIDALDLHGNAAVSLRRAFAPPGEVESSISLVGGVLLVASALSFTRSLQRLYQLAWDQPSLGLRAAKWGLIWLVAVIGVLSLRPVVLSATHGVEKLGFSLAFGAVLWWLTPYILLGRRIEWRRLLPTAVFTAVGMTALSIGSAVWMPRTVATSAERFGVIGVAFALLSWLVGAGVVLVVAAACGRGIDDWRRRAA